MESRRDTSKSLFSINLHFRWQKVVIIAECYIKGEESNTKKKVCEFMEHPPNVEGSHHQRNNNYTFPIKDNIMFKRVGNTEESFMPLPKHSSCIDLVPGSSPIQYHYASRFEGIGNGPGTM